MHDTLINRSFIESLHKSLCDKGVNALAPEISPILRESLVANIHLPNTRVQCSGDISSPSTQGCTAPRRKPAMCQSQGLQLRGVTPIQHGRLHSPRAAGQSSSEPSRHASSALRSSPGGRVAHQPITLPRRSCAPTTAEGPARGQAAVPDISTLAGSAVSSMIHVRIGDGGRSPSSAGISSVARMVARSVPAS
jgi:hypothetical protein